MPNEEVYNNGNLLLLPVFLCLIKNFLQKGTLVAVTLLLQIMHLLVGYSFVGTLMLEKFR